jgi:hypothetical protein
MNLQALIQHEDGCIDVLLVVVGVLRNFIIEICIGLLLLLGCPTLIAKFFYEQFLELSCCFDIFS